jgi:hypothetical protein
MRRPERASTPRPLDPVRPYTSGHDRTPRVPAACRDLVSVRDRSYRPQPSMVRKGSSVRVRRRALAFVLETSVSGDPGLGAEDGRVCRRGLFRPFWAESPGRGRARELRWTGRYRHAAAWPATPPRSGPATADRTAPGGSETHSWRRRGLWRGTGLAPLSCSRSVMASTFRSISYVRRRSPISLPGLDDCPPRVLTTICAPLPLGSFLTDRGRRVPPCPGRQARSRRSPRSRRCGRDGSTW